MKHELLAPAGSYEICEAVIAAGADAVYLGGERFSARALAPNLSDQEILKAIDLAHLHGKKVYLALNTLLKSREIDRELYRYIKPFYEHGLDAIIVQDYGVFQFVQRYFAGLPVHISTQMSVANAYGADFLRKKGAKRIIPARELTLSEIRTIYDATGLEIECFVHGALCYCYSGQCLLSSLIGARSGNRGRCAQPCRLPYRVEDARGRTIGEEPGYPLSLKDLCAVDLIPAMSEAGVTAFKIEGRMKALPYAAGVTKIYREYLDLYESDPAHYAVREEDKKKLLALGSRSGFTKGYYESGAAGNMLSRTDPSHLSTIGAADETPPGVEKIPVTGKITLSPGAPACLCAGFEDGVRVTVTGTAVEKAKTQPLSAETVREQIGKTGDTPYAFSEIKVEMEGDCFVPLGALNGLRREALTQLQEEMLKPQKRNMPPAKEPAKGLSWDAPAEETPPLTVTVSTAEQLAEVLACPFVDEICLDTGTYGPVFDEKGRFVNADFAAQLDKDRARIAAAGKKTGFCFPYIFRSQTSERFEQSGFIEVLGRFDTLLVRSYDSLGFALSLPNVTPERIRLDAGVPVFSTEAWQDFSAAGIGGYTASYELNAGELSHMPNAKAEFVVYGTIPVMVSAQCVYANYDECKKAETGAGAYYLSDRLGNKFLIQRDCKDGYNVIYNSRPLFLFHRAGEVMDLAFGSLRISLVNEDAARTAELLSDYRRGFLYGEKFAAPEDTQKFTNGHFRRGVV